MTVDVHTVLRGSGEALILLQINKQTYERLVSHTGEHEYWRMENPQRKHSVRVEQS